MIQLISDTVTRPTTDMLQAMMRARVGDDVFKQDPSVNELEEYAAGLFDKEAALFCPSGTMTNQIAVKVHTNPLDELICDINSHVYQYETGGYGFHSGIGIQLLHGDRGRLSSNQIEDAIRPLHDWLPKSTLVVLENSCNRAGGSYYTVDQLKPIYQLVTEKGLSIHLDGARLFNVLVETGENTRQYGPLFDSISICLSKGLGAPVGSLLIGDKSFIAEARRVRKVMGGGMRQAGFLAAAGMYALQNHVERLKLDNERARRLGQFIQNLPYTSDLRPVETNIVIFDVTEEIGAGSFIEYLNKNGINASAFGKNTIRFVTHLDITEEMIEKTEEVLERMDI
jgi:threonine aldolase